MAADRLTVRGERISVFPRAGATVQHPGGHLRTIAGDPQQLVAQLAPGGCLASTLLFGADQHPAAVSIVADPSREVLDRLAADVAAGRLTLPITRRYPLADAPTALAEFSEGTIGKYAVDIG